MFIIFNNKKFFVTFITIISLVGYGVFVFASAPPGGYTPGQILDPDCAPLETDCVVTLPTGASVTADNGLTATGSNVQLGGTLLQNTVIDQDGNDLNITNGNFSFTNGNNNIFAVPGIFSTY